MFVEIVFVNDASPLSDWEKVKEITSLDPSVVGVNLSRNFGQHHAITAGLDLAQGDWVAVMDGDLQHRPKDILKLLKVFKRKEADFVIGTRNLFKKKKHNLSILRLTASRLLILIVNLFLGYKTSDPMSGFFIFKK